MQDEWMRPRSPSPVAAVVRPCCVFLGQCRKLTWAWLRCLHSTGLRTAAWTSDVPPLNHHERFVVTDKHNTPIGCWLVLHDTAVISARRVAITSTLYLISVELGGVNPHLLSHCWADVNLYVSLVCVQYFPCSSFVRPLSFLPRLADLSKYPSI